MAEAVSVGVLILVVAVVLWASVSDWPMRALAGLVDLTVEGVTRLVRRSRR